MAKFCCATNVWYDIKLARLIGFEVVDGGREELIFQRQHRGHCLNRTRSLSSVRLPRSHDRGTRVC